MPRDTTALTIQGPDNGTGNALLVQNATPANNQIDLEQIRAVNAVTAAAGVLKVGMADSVNTNILAVTAGDLANFLQVAHQGGVPLNTTAAANTAIAQTFAAVAGQRTRIMSLSFYYIGANTAGIFTITDGGTTVFRFDFPASQNSLLQLTLPPGGIIGSVNSAVVVNLPAGGAGTNAVLNVSRLTW